MSDIDQIVNNVISSVRQENARNSTRIDLATPLPVREYLINSSLPRSSYRALQRSISPPIITNSIRYPSLARSYREVDLELKKAALETSLNAEKKNKESLNYFLNLEMQALKEKNRALEITNSRLQASFDKEKLQN